MICLDSIKNLNIVAQQNRLSVSPCCLIQAKPTNTIDFHNNSYINSIRDEWLNNTPPGVCKNCQRMDGANRWYAEHNQTDLDIKLTRIDYWVGNTCNLRCVICGPDNSSAWEQELAIPSKKQITNTFWKDLDLSQLQFIHFNGGEPLLSKEHIRFLEAIPDPSQVEINYNTNGTILPTPHLLELWSKFKLVLLDFSIDEIGAKFEYIRYPAKWDDIVNNLQWYISNSPVNCMFAVNTSIGYLNSNTTELDKWLQENFSTNRLGDPIEHRKQKVSGILSTSNDASKVESYLNKCDQRRGTSWRGTFPELTKVE